MSESAALALFSRLIDLPEPGREALLAAADPATAARVRALLAADAALETDALPDAPPPLPPPVIGPWELHEMIGAGGMGSVWRARRGDGLFDQVVAIKFMRARAGEIDLGTLIDAERRSLARMDHDNIARILDGGTTAGGLHYIVMEHVAGDRLDDVAAPPAARVRLVRQAAAALAHAHAQGIVHCDVKPANLLVTPEGRVKLIDFGIARLAEGTHRLPDGMTRAYASPERLAGQPATTADDVWSLAVTLREMLGDDPLPRAADMAAVLARATDPDPARRYRSIDAFDADLANWQAGRPVAARRATAAYVIARFAGRRPGTVAALGAALAGLVGALAVIATLYVSADRARAEAETRFAELRNLARFMIFDLNGMLEQVPGATPARAAMSDQAQAYLDALALAGEAGLRMDAAAGLIRLAEVQGVPSRPNLGQGAAAAANLERARAMLDGLIAAGDGPGLRALRARVLYYRAMLTAVQDQDPVGEAALAALAEADALLADGGAPPAELAALLLGIRMTRADALVTQGDVAGALVLQEAEQARLDALPDDLRAAMDWPWEAGRLALLTGDSLFYLDRKAEALAAYDRGVSLLEQGLAAAPLNRRLLTALFTAQYSRSATLADLGDAPAGLVAAEAAVALAARMRDWDPSDRLAARMVASADTQRALLLRANGRAAEALAVIDARLAAPMADDLEGLRSAAILHRIRAELLAGTGGDACPAYAAALVAWAGLNARQPLSQMDREGDLALVLAGMEANGCAMP